MNVTARPASPDDLSELLRMYRLLEAELIPLEEIWPLADGLPEPAEDALAALMADPGVSVTVGEIDTCPVGFLIARSEALLPQAEGRVVGSIRYVFTELGAREVGVGEAMIEAYLASARADGVDLFDAHVTPGHRLTKNFFESNGFSARSIVMNHSDDE